MHLDMLWDCLLTDLLWWLLALGAWNLVNALGRLHYRVPQVPQYLYSIFLGVWAGLILLLE